MAPNSLPLAATGLQPVQEEYSPADHWLRRLCSAILADALKALGGPSRSRQEAQDWVKSDASYFFSFRLVCTVLDLNMAAVRCHIVHRFAPGSVLQTAPARLPRPSWRGSTAGRPASYGRRSEKYGGRGLR